KVEFFGWNPGPALAFAPNNRILAASCQLLDVATGETLRKLKNDSPAAGLLNRLKHLAFTPDSKMLVTDCALWEIATGKKLRNLKELLNKEGKPEYIYSWNLSSDGTLLAATHRGDAKNSSKTILSFWDVKTGILRSQHVADSVNHNSFIAFLPDEQ